MTDVQFEAKYQELVEQVKEGLLKEGRRLLHCGGVTPDEYGDDYLLPRTILTVALENEASQWLPLDPKHRASIRNLQHF